MLTSRRLFLAGTGGFALAGHGKPARAQNSDGLQPLRSAMARGRFVTYQPTALAAIDGVLSPASDDSIRADLAVLRPYFDSLITYGALAGNERVPDIAASLQFKAVIVGVWDIGSAQEIDNAVAAWKRNQELVVGLSVGNETVLGRRGTWNDLTGAIAAIRQKAPGLPLATTESFAEYLDDPQSSTALSRMDFMLVNIHPIFESWFATAPDFNRADFVVQVVDRLAARFSAPILVKETGTPTGPKSLGFSEDMQSAFYRALERQFAPSESRAFSYFSAFDAPWRVQDFMPMPGAHPEESHWGIFTEDRRPKSIIAGIPRLFAP